jgi:indole-3-glycerol phosphate synthase
MSVLNKIVEKKRDRLAYSQSRTPLKELKSVIRNIEHPREFKKAIKRDSGNVKFIAEIKKASPSKGIIRENFDHEEITSIYENKKIDAISVITEEDFFQGNLAFISDIKKITTRPVLRKDFIIDEYQIYEARANQADAVLLIASLLERNQAEEYIHLLQELGLSALFEIHDFNELEMVLNVKAPIIGINNRNLKTLMIDFNISFELKEEIPDDRIVVSESGIKTRDNVLSLERAGMDAVLIGTVLMEAQDISKKIDDLRGKK